MMSEVRIAWGLPWPAECARRFETIKRFALRRQAWGVAFTAAAMVDGLYVDLRGAKKKQRANKAFLARVRPLYERERAESTRDEDDPLRLPWLPRSESGVPFTPPTTKRREELKRRLGKAVRVEPASRRIVELDRLSEKAFRAGFAWESFLAAYFSAAATSIVIGGERHLERKVLAANRLTLHDEVQRVFGRGGNPIHGEMKCWQAAAHRAIRARLARKATLAPGDP